MAKDYLSDFLPDLKAFEDKIMAFEIDLNYNIWKNIGYIIRKPKNAE